MSKANNGEPASENSGFVDWFLWVISFLSWNLNTFHKPFSCFPHGHKSPHSSQPVVAVLDCFNGPMKRNIQIGIILWREKKSQTFRRYYGYPLVNMDLTVRGERCVIAFDVDGRDGVYCTVLNCLPLEKSLEDACGRQARR